MRLITTLAVAAVLLAGPGCRFGGESGESATIVGYAYEDATGEPIAGALVVIQPLGTSVRTARDGSYRFDELPRGRYTVRAGAEGFLDAEVKGVKLSPGKTEWVKLFLKRRPEAAE